MKVGATICSLPILLLGPLFFLYIYILRAHSHIVGSTDILEQLCHHRKFYWMVLL